MIRDRGRVRVRVGAPLVVLRKWYSPRCGEEVPGTASQPEGSGTREQRGERSAEAHEHAPWRKDHRSGGLFHPAECDLLRHSSLYSDFTVSCFFFCHFEARERRRQSKNAKPRFAGQRARCVRIPLAVRKLTLLFC